MYYYDSWGFDCLSQSCSCLSSREVRWREWYGNSFINFIAFCTWNRNWKGYVDRLQLKPKLKRIRQQRELETGTEKGTNKMCYVKRVRQQTGLQTETEKGTSTDWTWNRNWKGQVYINRLDLIPKLKWGRQQTYGQLLTDSGQWWNTLATNGIPFWLLTVVDWRLTVSGNKRTAMKYPGDERAVDCWRLLIDGSAADNRLTATEYPGDVWSVLSVDGWLLTVSDNKRTAVGGRRLTVDCFKQQADSGWRPVVDCWLFQATNCRRLTVDCFRQQADSGCWLLTVSDNKRTTVDCFRQQADSGWRQTVECWLFQATSGQRWSSLPTPRRRTAYRTGWLSIRTASSGWPATALGPSSSLTRRPVATHKMSKLVCLSACQLVRLPASLSVCCQLVCLLPACLSVASLPVCKRVCFLSAYMSFANFSVATLPVCYQLICRLLPICLSTNCCQLCLCVLCQLLCVLPDCPCVCCQLICVSANLPVCLLPNYVSASLFVCLSATCLCICLLTCLCVCCQLVCVSVC